MSVSRTAWPRSGLLSRARHRLRYYRHGNGAAALALLLLRDGCAKLGVGLHPYFLVREGRRSVTPPEPRARCTYRRLEARDLERTARLDAGEWPDFHRAFDRGDLCVGALFEERVVALTWATFGHLHAVGHQLIALRPGEAALYGAVTHPAARGLGLAPRVRWEMYRLLRERGHETLLSLSFAFNRPSLRFKEKLGGEREGFWLWLGLAGRRPRRLLGRRRATILRDPTTQEEPSS